MYIKYKVHREYRGVARVLSEGQRSVMFKNHKAFYA